MDPWYTFSNPANVKLTCLYGAESPEFVEGAESPEFVGGCYRNRGQVD